MISIPKEKKIRSKKITESAKGEHCTLRIPGVCNNDPATTVLAHLPGSKGTGTKNHDLFGVYACSDCHDWMDGRAKKNGSVIGYRSHMSIESQLRALQETQLKLVQKGIVEVK